MLSSVEGTGLPLLTNYLSHLQSPNHSAKEPYNPPKDKDKDKPLEFNLTDNFLVNGVGIVVNGLVKEGKAVINQTVMLGPDRNQLFRQVVIKGIHVNRVS